MQPVHVWADEEMIINKIDMAENALTKLQEIVSEAIENAFLEIKETPNIVLSETDFERLLSTKIEDLLRVKINQQTDNRYVVHNQVTHYMSEESCNIDYRVDILIMRENGIMESSLHHKGFSYFVNEENPAIVIELKYFRKNDYVYKIEGDIGKIDVLTQDHNTFVFIIALLEIENPTKRCDIQRRYDSALVDKSFSKLIIESKSGECRKSE